MTIETARVLAEQVLAKYANLVTLAMREDVARLVLHVEQVTQQAATRTDPPRPALVKDAEGD